jgi:3D (Asp-Asp-Asp) domain-containing protein
MNILKTIKNISILRGKNLLTRAIFAGIIVGICLFGIIIPRAINADYVNATNASYVAKATNDSLKKAVKTIKVVVTAYSSSWDETTGIPGVSGTITASGRNVAPEIIANNMLPFGTKVRIPKLYGDKIFIVGDRMASYKSNYHIDIWMPSKPLAVNFGVKTADIEILEN